MSIQRHRLQREKNAGAYMEPAADGNWVEHADHAAAPDAQYVQIAEGLHDADRANGELLRRVQAVEDKAQRMAAELGDKKCLGLEKIQRLEDEVAALTERAERAEKYVLHSDHAAELARVEGVISDYAEQIREYRAREKAAEATHGAPMAWAVFLPKGDMYDYAVFPHVEDAKQHAALLDEDEPEGTEPRGVMPLYGDPSKALAILRAECEAWREITLQPGWTGTMPVGHMVATNAAGILKGAAQ